MADFLTQLKKYVGGFGSNLVRGAIPGIASGLLNEMFHQWHVDVAMVTQLVQDDQSLWARLTPEARNELSDIATKAGSLDFITPSYFITSIRKEFPGVASLFLNWPEAAEWLDRQIIELKIGVTDTVQSQ